MYFGLGSCQRRSSAFEVCWNWRAFRVPWVHISALLPVSSHFISKYFFFENDICHNPCYGRFICGKFEKLVEYIGNYKRYWGVNFIDIKKEYLVQFYCKRKRIWMQFYCYRKRIWKAIERESEKHLLFMKSLGTCLDCIQPEGLNTQLSSDNIQAGDFQ